MLKLERVEIAGFKSFVDRTEVLFPEGITAIVGPNGCGKSNIGDAINWVLGEQSARMLRGKEMSDVIFAGSEGRKPVGMAEVSLTLRGLTAAGLGDEDAVVVTRRLHRDGDSEYLLNGARARLKDIQEVLEKTHVGARTYATIEQGRIEQILGAKPKDRRLLIEDAAGIAGYKHKRRLTELKLEATQANLLRVQDVVAEVERQIRALRRQAGRARRYRRLRDELRRQETNHLALRVERLDAELRTCIAREREARDAEVGRSAEVSATEAAIAAERLAIDHGERDHRERSEGAHRLDLDLDRQEGQIAGLRQRIAEATELESRRSAEGEQLARSLAERETDRAERGAVAEAERGELERIREQVAAAQIALDQADERRRALRAEVERLRLEQFEALHHAAEARNGLRAIEEALDRSAAQRARLEADRTEAGDDLSRWEREGHSLASAVEAEREQVLRLRDECARLEAQLEEARRQETLDGDALGAAREEHRSTAARLATLEDVSTRFAGVSDGVRTVLSEGQREGVRTHGVVADYIEAGPEIEALAESYLETFLPTVIVEDDVDLERAAAIVRRHGAGRTGLLGRTRPTGATAVGVAGNGLATIPPDVLADPRVRGRLRERLDLRTSSNGMLQDRLGDAVLVSDLRAALELHRRHPRADYVTTDGDVVQASGLVWAGQCRAGDHGLLAHKRRTHEARQAEAAAGARAVALAETLEARRSERAGLESDLRERRAEVETRAHDLVEVEVRARRAHDEHERTERRSEILSDELGSLGDEAERLLERLAEQRTTVGRAEARHDELAAQLAETVRAAEAVEAELELAVGSTSVAREGLAARGERQEALENELRRLALETQELAGRMAAARADADAARRRASDARAELERVEVERAEALALREELARALSLGAADLAELRARVAERETSLRTAREALDALREVTRDAAIERGRLDAAREHLDELARQELGVDASTARDTAVAAGIDLGAIDAAQVEAVLVDLRARIEALGPVNMTAVEEFAELEERQRFLATQRLDLDQSMASLRETIRRINRSSREKFLEAFESIRRSYQEVFQLLFRGGRADLRLEESEDVLECGVEILAQPPGKRLANITLLSGGEKSLSAIALLFAIFRYQPSPFCMLDEVDAALDDVNVSRFTRMLGEYAGQTQFIIVTHNKVTMEAARLLYGVTMQEPGVSKLMSLELR